MDQLVRGVERREDKGIFGIGHVVQHAARRKFLGGLVAKQKDRFPATPHDPAAVGHVGGRAAVFSDLVDEEVVHLARAVDILGVDGEAGNRLGEFTLADQSRRQVSPDFEQRFAHRAIGERLNPKIEKQCRHGNRRSQTHRRGNNPPTTHPAGKTDDDFLLGVQPIQCDHRCDEHRDWKDHVDQLRGCKQGDLQKNQRALALIDDQVQCRQALTQKGDRRKRRGGHQRWAEQLTKQIAVDQSHRSESGLFRSFLPRPRRGADLNHASPSRTTARAKRAWIG